MKTKAEMEKVLIIQKALMPDCDNKATKVPAWGAWLGCRDNRALRPTHTGTDA